MRVPRADQSAACTVRWRGSWRGFWGLKGFVTGRYVGRVKGYSCVVALKVRSVAPSLDFRSQFRLRLRVESHSRTEN
jgi:hypothetical protein